MSLDPFHPVNLVETQRGYVPLRDRFKSFPVDRQFNSLDEIYFINRIGQRLEHATLDMILKVPAFIRQEVQERNRRPPIGTCLVTTDGKFILADGKCLLMNPGECLIDNEGQLITVDDKCLQLVNGLLGEYIVTLDGKVITTDGGPLDVGGN